MIMRRERSRRIIEPDCRRRIILVEVSRCDRTIYGISVSLRWFRTARDCHPIILIVATDHGDSKGIKCNPKQDSRRNDKTGSGRRDAHTIMGVESKDAFVALGADILSLVALSPTGADSAPVVECVVRT